MSGILKKIPFLLLLSLFAALSGCVSSQEAENLQRRLARLEQKNRHLEKSVTELDRASAENREKAQQVEAMDERFQGKEQALREQFASLRVGLDRLREENLRIKGMVEEANHTLGTRFGDAQQERSDKIATLETGLSSANERLARLEQFMGLEPDSGGTSPAGLGEETGEESTEEALYRSAKRFLDEGKAALARERFGTLLARFPKSDNADNAQFWIGETYYREKWYEKAILEYQKVIEKYPKGNKVPSAYLKQGMAFGNLGEKANARLILKELIKKFPSANEANVAKKQMKGL